ncbi:MAG: hypothetical protein BroJett022_06150 [Actinomycetes bacterium]|nr:MAG: hypothetical protein BroJett022_06150 [Actinomycetes bacterium]
MEAPSRTGRSDTYRVYSRAPHQSRRPGREVSAAGRVQDSEHSKLESRYFDNPGDPDSSRHRRGDRESANGPRDASSRRRDERCPAQVYAAPGATGGWSRARLRPLTCR